ncbi:MAG: trigger factor [Cellvibrionaceae bacterium]
MQVSVETTSGLERRLTIAVPAADVDGQVNAKLAEVAKTAKINGFRKGKVPLKVINQQYGAAARQEVASDLINSSYMKAIEQESVRPAGYPKIEVNSIEAGKDLEYVATIEVYPEVELGEFDGYELTRLSAEIKDSDVDKAIESLREQQASFSEVERAAADGDQTTIDFVGTKDGEEFQGGKGDDFKLVLGSGSMIPGFEDGVVGMKSGDTKTLDLTFPEDYQVDDLKGADVKFDVTVKKVEEKSLPAVDADFMKHFGSDSEEQFKGEIKKNMERELKKAVQGKLKASVMDQLVEHHQVELPKALIESEIEALREQMMQQFGGMQQNKSLDLKSLLPDDMFAEQAERRVSLGLIVGEVVKKNDIKVDADKVRAYIDETAASYDKPQEVVDYYYQNQQMLSGVESVVLEDMVVDTILEQAKVTDTTVDYDEAIAQPQQA